MEDRVAAGIAGLAAPLFASEVDTLTLDERRMIVRTIVRQAAGRVPVIAGASAAFIEESVAMARLGTDLGCAGVLIAAPPAIRDDFPALLAHFRRIARTGTPMLMIQDLEWHGPGMPVEVIRRLFEEVEPFRCIKVEVVPAGPKYTAILRATDGRLIVAGGWAVTQYVEALDRGMHALLATGHYWVLNEVYRRHAAGDRAGAQRLFERLLPMLAFGSQHLDVSNQFLKLLAVREGIFRTARMRRVSVPFDEFHRRVAGDLVERAASLDSEVGRRG